jgi:hypothetical protein
MNVIAHILPLFGLAGAVVGLTAVLTRWTRDDDERWILDRRKRERRDKSSWALPPTGEDERRAGERRRAKSSTDRA